MIRKNISVLANGSTDTKTVPNKGVYAARFNIRADLDAYYEIKNGRKTYPYKGKEIACLQKPILGNITSYFNYYGREPGRCVVTVTLKGTKTVIAQYIIDNYAWVGHRGYIGNLRPVDDRPKKQHTVNGITYKSVEMTYMYTENTMASFEAAIQAGAYGIETDPKLTKDGKLVVFHDLVFGGTANKGKPYEHTYGSHLSNGPDDVHVYEKTLAEIQKYRIRRVGSRTTNTKFNKIPTFDEYLTLCDKYNVHPVIDISNDFHEPERQQKIANAVAAALDKHPISKKNVLALPGTYKFLAKAMGLKDPTQILFKYDMDMDSIGKSPDGRHRALLNAPPWPEKLANWQQIKEFEWFK